MIRPTYIERSETTRGWYVWHRGRAVRYCTTRWGAVRLARRLVKYAKRDTERTEIK